ncbi:hypothetical protein K504DRAFT_481837 [Pleomassaria siparia CBS 279.74]|uniref:Sensor histidine kinase-like protein/response regulator n=1 Tax=Pleomassaria siparia CBS 279.74 TaxID=1314801 RepID=A0A6G1K9F3_9PLEO|nr:hypothetical protein K504DRAFT_481837 [Pleomassaria siparia CBS 279.74]
MCTPTLTIPIPRPPKAGVSETKRDRDVYRLYGSAFRDIVQLDHTSALGSHVPIAAKDSALVAFAQLAAIRLGASRAMISLIDAHRQHILAEATPTTSLRGGSRVDLWVGNVSLPREALVCEHVLNMDTASITASEQAAVIIKDLADSQYAHRSFVKDNVVRFYAGVALTSPRGAIVGALAIMDNKPRDGLPPQDISWLQDLAATVMEHLDTHTIRDQQMRGEQLTRGLISFAEGASALQPYHHDHRPQNTQQAHSEKSTFASVQRQDASNKFSVLQTDSNVNMSDPVRPNPTNHHSNESDKSDGGSQMRALQESILPRNSKAMFARAANIMRASSDLDGVLVLDASVASSAHLTPDEDAESSSYESRSSEGEGPRWLPEITHNSGSRSASIDDGKGCQVLGFSTRDTSSVAENVWSLTNRSLLEVDLRRMLSLYPLGHIINFTEDGELISSSDDSESSTSTVGPDWASVGSSPGSRQRRVRGKNRSQKIMSAIHTTLPGARSVAFVPFWDFDRSRWFAGCLCWTNEPDRLLTPKLDLLFFKVFGHSVMNELSKLDTIASDQVKTTFVSLISHELRSPLHGILGSIQFLQDSPLDSFQVTMLNSMEACGQTLLDTIDHVLDYSKINEPTQNVTTKRLRGMKTICLTSKPLRSHRPAIATIDYPSVDLGLATEEVVEAVFAGQSYHAITDSIDEGIMSPPDSRSGDKDYMFPTIARKRKVCFVILDIEEQDWKFSLSIGAWRRILMNIFGNALKFTYSGHIRISLRAGRSKVTRGLTHITVTVADTGLGIGQEFLANKVFQPFSQENAHSSGTGLGLSIVRQIMDNVGGKVEVTSEPNKGTQVVVKLAVPKSGALQADPPQRLAYLSALPRLQDRRICILHRVCPPTPDEEEEEGTRAASELFTTVLGTTLTESLKMTVVHTTEWAGHDADIVICPQPSFDYLVAIRESRTGNDRAPITIFIATDALEAATLRSDARILSKQSVVEIITQPCGPYKLASILSHCLRRYESLDENIQHQPPFTPLPSPQTGTPCPSQLGLTNPPIKPTMGMGSTPASEHGQCCDTNAIEHAFVGSRNTESSDLVPQAVVTPGLATPSDEAMGPLPMHSMRWTSNGLTPTPLESSSYVLITDDNAINRRLLVAFMNKRQLKYQEAENGLEAVTAYQEGRVRFDTILMDISMPVMDGMTATRLIREHESEYHIKPTHIIALTGLASASAKLEAWNAGVDFFMTKPVNFKALEAVLLQDKH